MSLTPVKIQSAVNYTPLWNAVHWSDPDMVKVFLSMEGCLQDRICPDGTTAFELAIGSNQFHIASMLLNSPLLSFGIEEARHHSQLIHTANNFGWGGRLKTFGVRK